MHLNATKGLSVWPLLRILHKAVHAGSWLPPKSDVASGLAAWRMAVPMSRRRPCVCRLCRCGIARRIHRCNVRRQPVKHAAGRRIVFISNQPRVGVSLLQQLGQQTTEGARIAGNAFSHP